MSPLPRNSESSAASTFDEDTIREHVEMLHRLAQGMQGKFVVSVFFANPNGEDRAGGAITHHHVGDVDGTVDAITAHSGTQNANVYICPNLMRPSLERGKKGGEADVVAVLALVADMDDDRGLAGQMPIDANYVIESSPGNHQRFILLDSPLPPAEAKTFANALRRGANSDHCTADVSHVWRVPGCLNWPNRRKIERGRSPEPVAVAVSAPWQGDLTGVDELRTALEPWMGPASTHSSVTIGELPSVEGIVLSDRALELLAADDVGDRSAWASKVVEQLAFDALTAEQACAVFLAATGDWFRRYDAKDPLKDFGRIWGKFAVPMIEAREEQAELARQFVANAAAKKALVAANDNVPATNAPAMHPNPFTPEAAGGLLEKIATWVNDTAIVPVPEPSLAAAIALIGGCFGKMAIGPTNAGVNVYFATLLATAGGGILQRRSAF